MNNILIEDQQFDFLSVEFPRPISFIRRFQQGNNRFYYTVSKEGKVTLYSSGTTLISDGYAEDSIGLEKWRNSLKAEGKDPVTELLYAASRGTLMHTLLGDYIQGKPILLNEISHHFETTHPDVDVPLMKGIINKDTEWLSKAILAFAQFVKDYKVKPLALELLMKSEKYGVASPIDMICEMEIMEEGPWGEPLKSGPNKGQPKVIKRPKKIYAIIDFKSSQKGFYDKHYFQLQLYKRIVEENYPDIKIEGLFNWSPKDWRTTPSYNLKEQSDGRLNDLCETVFEQGRIKHSFKEPKVTRFKDILDITSYEEGDIVETISLIDYLEGLHGKDREEDSEQTD